MNQHKPALKTTKKSNFSCSYQNTSVPLQSQKNVNKKLYKLDLPTKH